MIIDILLLAAIWVFILDISGFADEIKSLIASYFKVKPENLKINKPFFCSLCMTFWTGLLYLIITSNFSLISVCYLLFIACSTPLIRDLYYMFYDMIEFIIRKTDNIWQK